MLRDLGPVAYTPRLLGSHCVTCMSSPSSQRSIDVTIEHSIDMEHLSQLKRWTEPSLPVPVPAGRSTQTRASEAKFESAASCVMRSERIRQEVHCVIKGLANRD
jgi:hypothetical protein